LATVSDRRRSPLAQSSLPIPLAFTPPEDAPSEGNVLQGAKLAGANKIIGVDINPDREE